MNERQTIRVNVMTWWSDESMTLKQFIESIEKEVPTEHLNSVMVSFERGCYDEGDRFKVYYDRDETDTEIAEREATKRRYAQQAEAQEKAEYERLKAKFNK